MDFSTLIPIIIFFYVLSTIFNTDSSKNKNKKPTNYQGTGSRPQASKPQNNRETKSSGSSWREMFEELERELFPKEVRREEPTGYREDEVGGFEGTWESERTYEREDRVDREVSYGYEEGYSERTEEVLSSGIESNQSKEETGLQTSQTMPISQPQVSFSQKRQVSSQSTGFLPSSNPFVQGVIWAEILGKPRSQSPWGHRGKNF